MREGNDGQNHTNFGSISLSTCVCMFYMHMTKLDFSRGLWVAQLCSYI